MTSKERVRAAVNHTQPDKVPVDFGATAVTGMHITVVEALRRHFGLDMSMPVKLEETFQCLGRIEEDLSDAIGIDVADANGPNTFFGFKNDNWKEWSAPWGQQILVPGEFNTTPSPKGGIVLYPEGDLSVPPSGHMPDGGYFFDAIIRQEPLPDDDEDLKVEDNLEDFQPISDEVLASVRAKADHQNERGKFIIANIGGTGLGDIALVPALFLKHPKGIRDITEWYISTVSRQDFLHEIFEQQYEIAIANFKKLFAAVGNDIDAVFICGTDFGTQDSTFCSVETYRSLYHPHYRKLNDWIHTNTSWKSFKHSCGAVAEFIPEFIASGFDLLNPVQTSAKGMDPAFLKREFGKDIAFWGGGVDTQKILPFGTPEDVRKEVLYKLETFARDGGFIFNAIHNIQAKTPVENVVAMINAVKEFNGDPAT